MPLKILIALLLIATLTVVSPRIHTHQHTLTPSKSSFQPIVFPLNKEKRSYDAQKQLFTFLQKHQEKFKSSSFLQQDITPTNIDQEKIPAILGLDNFQNTQYVGTIGLGNKENTYKVIFDTGSTPLFVNSAFCKDSACLRHPQFDPRTSNTLLLSNPPMGMKVTYGSGVLEGVHVYEDVYLGDLKAPQMSLYLVLHQTSVLDTASFDGVAGLGFPEKNEFGENKLISLFDVMKDQLPDPYFSFHLRRNEEIDSYVMFGGYNEDHMASDLVWHDVIHPNYWMLKLTNIYVGEHKIDFCQTHVCGVVIDSGTSLITAPSFAIWQMQSYLPETTCNQRDQLPPVTFEIESQRYSIDPDEYILTVDSSGKPELFTHSEDATQCSGLFTPVDIQTNYGKAIFILGDTFLTKYYAVFDREKNRIGMALQKR